MPYTEHTDVLIVGAGPVGMFTALRLAQRGIGVRIIDRAARPATHSYACGLHAHSLKLLGEAGLAGEILAGGHRIESVNFHEGDGGATVRLGDGDDAGFVVLPQSGLEGLLENKLRELGIEVQWNYRLESLHPDSGGVTAHIDRLGETVTGYIVPHWESVVLRSVHHTSAFVIGADGHESLVRRALGIPYEKVGDPELYVVYEFESDAASSNEIQVILDRDRHGVFWPLTEGRCRWSFRWNKPDDAVEFPTKDRNVFWAEAAGVARRTLEHLNRLIQVRAPWFQNHVDAMDWAIDVQFEHRLAACFGRGRCLLVGDAAHQTSPVGMQSMNVGFREAEMVAGLLQGFLQGEKPLESLLNYDRAFHAEWEALQGVTGRLAPLDGAAPRVGETAGLAGCLPASGEEHTRMLRELGYQIL